MRTPYLRSQASWDHFWESRKSQLSINDQKIYGRNFNFILNAIKQHYQESMFWSKKSLEVGCGRGIISSFLRPYGFKTFGIDILDNRISESMNRKRFIFGDARALPYKPGTFDVIITYGLLEHFEFYNQVAIITECMELLKCGGIAIHYVIPKKLTNYFEDKNIYRDKCERLRRWYPKDWVYPVLSNMDWETNKWLGKGFFFTTIR